MSDVATAEDRMINAFILSNSDIQVVHIVMTDLKEFYFKKNRCFQTFETMKASAENCARFCFNTTRSSR